MAAKKSQMKGLDWVAWVLVVIGALNWGFVGVANLNLVESVFGVSASLVQVAYILIGLGGLYMLWVALGKQ